MMRFRSFFREMAEVSVADLDVAFLKRAQKVTSFNLTSKDFTSLKYKKEIQHLIRMHFFPKFDLSRTISGKPTKKELNSLIRSLKKENISKFNSLHNYPISAIGPGEVTLFFLLDDAHLGGGSSAAADIKIGSVDYEVKAGNFNEKQNAYKDFKLGGTVPMEKMVNAAFALRNIVDPNLKMGKRGKAEKNGVNQQQQEAIFKDRKLMAQWKSQVQDPYRKAAVRYLNKNPLILLINTTPKPEVGEVYHIGKIKPNNVFVDVITQGTIKPKILADKK